MYLVPKRKEEEPVSRFLRRKIEACALRGRAQRAGRPRQDQLRKPLGCCVRAISAVLSGEYRTRRCHLIYWARPLLATTSSVPAITVRRDS